MLQTGRIGFSVLDFLDLGFILTRFVSDFELRISDLVFEGSKARGVEKIRSTKAAPQTEIRNKFKCSKRKMFQTNSIRIYRFGFSGFGIYLAAVCFGFGASDFGFCFGGVF
jgi:hypothetical protein